VSVSGDLQEIARREMLEMIERLLLEADLEKELPKLEVYGKTIDGIKEFLNFLLMNPETGEAIGWDTRHENKFRVSVIHIFLVLFDEKAK
jgi:hypothetical protein